MSLIEKAVKHLERMNQQHDTAETGEPRVSRAASSQTFLTTVTPQPAASRPVQIDLERLAASGMIVPDTPGSLIAEEFRVLKRPLLANAARNTNRPIRNANLIMVTSALPQEGKSFVAANLAMSIAMELERTALLIDADVARPSLPGLLGLHPQAGLLDVLQDRTRHIGEVMLRTNVANLNLVMAGTPHPRATEMLASETMARLLDEIANRYPDRIIIFDSPPLLLTTQARALARHMGQIVFVVHAEQTLQSAVKEALATIDGCPMKYAVLNQARSTNPLVYGYEYHYGSGR
ncbi:MAG TPA: XrtA-associated tyrosine autokinase [Burkholderiaceae bacterium]|nr:XrtA-associated tyrosine autokinase [Burkholderiaceae bacterium]